MFERHRQNHANEHYEQQLAEWQELRDSTTHLLEVAQSFEGGATDQIMLKPGEHLFASLTNSSLIEERRGAGQWQGHSQGFSIPVAGGVRYRVGQTRGHYVQGAPVPTAIDTGTMFITDQRAIFRGSRQTRECAFSKLIAVAHDPDGSTTFSVSNRQKPTTVHYGPKVAGWFDFRLELALAHFRGTVPALLDQLREQLAQVDQSKPVAPTLAS